MLINLSVTFRIMLLDMLKLGRAPERLDIPIQIPQPLVQRRVPGANVPDVALEMLHVHGVEADDGRVQADVGFGDGRTEVKGVGVLGEMGFRAVEGFEECFDGSLVRFLGTGSAVSFDGTLTVEIGKVVILSYVAKPDL